MALLNFINKNLILLLQLLFLNVVGQNIIQCAATIQIDQSDTALDKRLLRVAFNGEKEQLEQLITKGASVNAVSHGGLTVLMIAAWKEHKEIVELLLKAHANVNAISETGATALREALKNGNKEIIKLLLRAGADIEYIDVARDSHNNQEIAKIIEQEKPRRETVVKKWIKENLAKKINEATSGQLIPDISQLISEYATEYNDLPLEYRLSN